MGPFHGVGACTAGASAYPPQVKRPPPEPHELPEEEEDAPVDAIRAAKVEILRRVISWWQWGHSGEESAWLKGIIFSKMWSHSSQ